MIRVTIGEVPYYCFASLAGEGLVHGVFTRLGGVSRSPFASLNVGRTVGDDPVHVVENQRRILAALGVSTESVVTAQQVHGERVAVVTVQDAGQTLPQTDALISATPGLTLLLRFADCVPVLFYAPRQKAVALAHAGWQGTLKRIAAKTAEALCAQVGCAPGELYAAIGPAIGPCCFEVGEEVAGPLEAQYGPEPGPFVSLGARVVRRLEGARPYVDLWQANLLQLRQVGLTQIELAAHCTACHRDEFFSHRAEHGRTGRFAVLIGLR